MDDDQHRLNYQGIHSCIEYETNSTCNEGDRCKYFHKSIDGGRIPIYERSFNAQVIATHERSSNAQVTGATQKRSVNTSHDTTAAGCSVLTPHRSIEFTTVVDKTTRLCNYFSSGLECPYKENCKFLHEKNYQEVWDRNEDQDLPRECTAICIPTTDRHRRPGSNTDFIKTRLCDQWSLSNQCRNGANCNFAHGQAELRRNPSLTASAWRSRNVSTAAPQAIPNVPLRRENEAARGTANCNFAHGQAELRRNPSSTSTAWRSRNVSAAAPQATPNVAPPRENEAARGTAFWRRPRKYVGIYADWIDDIGPIDPAGNPV